LESIGDEKQVEHLLVGEGEFFISKVNWGGQVDIL